MGKQVIAITGTTQTRLSYWVREGVIVPAEVSGTGRGKPKLYGFKELVNIRVVNEFVEAGVSVRKIKEAIFHLRMLLPQAIESSLASKRVFTDGKKIYIANEDGTLEEAFATRQLAFHFELSKCIKYIKDNIEDFNYPQRYERDVDKIVG